MTATFLWDLADITGSDLHVSKDDKITGTIARVIPFADLNVTFKFKIVSSYMQEDKDGAFGIILCRGQGDLVLLFATGSTAGPGIVAVLDASKMEAPEKLLETKKVVKVSDAMAMLSQAIVVAQERVGRGGGWRTI